MAGRGTLPSKLLAFILQNTLSGNIVDCHCLQNAAKRGKKDIPS